MPIKIFASLVMAVTMAFGGCSLKKGSLREYQGTYLESVKLNFEAGVKALEDGQYDKAIGYFQFVRSKYPFSKYAALSDLRIADVKFAQKKWLDAASAYEIFIRLHPRHEEVSYAHYRVGASYFQAVPNDFFLLPPSTARDQSFTEEALLAIELFIAQFPGSPYIEDAKKKRESLLSKLAKHDQHIAEYYVKRGRYEAAVSRYIGIEKLYPETEEAVQSLFLAAEILSNNLKDIDRAIDIYRQIVEKAPDRETRERAKALRDELKTQRKRD